jgi:hypothetical protein
MKVWDAWISAVAALLPRDDRGIWIEQWRADLRDAKDVGVSRCGLALSMILMVGSRFFGRPSRGRAIVVAITGVLAAISTAAVPSLSIAYITIALLLVAQWGARRGIRELLYAGLGVLILVASIAMNFVLLRTDELTNIALGFGVLVFGAAMAAGNYGRAWAPRSGRPGAVWLTVGSATIAVVSFWALAFWFVLGIHASERFGPGEDPTVSPVVAVLALGAFWSLTIALPTMLIAGIVAIVTPHGSQGSELPA